MAALALLAIPAGIRADTLISSTPYSYTGAVVTYTAPANTQYVVIKAWGAGGGTGVYTAGGGGAFVTAAYNVTAGQPIYIWVGGAGLGALTGGWQTGGSALGGGGAGGGGCSEVQTPDGYVYAGGGGGGGNGQTWGSNGGAGGGPTGANGGSPSGGLGATQSAVGAGGAGNSNGAAGSNTTGGNSGANTGYVGGGGGGGFLGGGGGASGAYSPTGSFGGGGGGGGSSDATGTPTSYSYAGGSGSTPGGTSDPDFPGSSIGAGGPASVYTNGFNGYVVIKAYIRTGPPTFTSTPPAQSLSQGQAANFSIPATGNPVPTFGATGLPTGLSANATTGQVTGNATVAGTFNATLSATNSYGTVTAPQTWTVAAAVFTETSYVSPTSVMNGSTVTLYREGSANFGIAWTQNTVWLPNGNPYVVGNFYAPNPLGSTVYTPGGGPGTYTWQFRIVDNYSNYQDQVVTFTVYTPAASAPTSVSATSVGSTFVTISWSGASAQAGIASYTIYRNGTFIESFGTSASSGSYTDTTAAPSTAYTYTVVTVDIHGNASTPSSGLNVNADPDFEVFSPLP
jgi:predicted secreted protein